ncbi:replicative DNA helicase [Cellulomonas soli]
MTIEDLEYGMPPSSDRGGNAAYDRTPPQDLDAERSVLGGMMISKDAIADVIEQLRGTDFYRPAHEVVYDAILDLYGRGEPADAITVADELTKRGEIGRIGGAPYLHTLISSVPTAANAGYYARIVRERSILRKLVEAGTRIVQLGYGTDGGDVDEIVNNAQAEVYAVTERRASEDYLPLSEIIGGAVDEIEAAGHRGEGMIGVPTGFSDLDRLTNGLHPGQMIVVAARPAIGKALALDTPLPTPTGWTTMGEVRVGDQLIAADGTPTTVVAATEVLVDRPCYRVTFDDGTQIVADALHEWATRTRAERRGTGTDASIRTTEEIAATLRCRTAEARANHSVETASPLQLPDAALPLDPYALGVWLGDGHSGSARFTSADPEIAMRIEGRGLDVVLSEAGSTTSGAARLYTLRQPDEAPVDGLLRTLGVLGDKHIPAVYLRGSETQRRELLAGLLDTDGTVNPTGSPQLTFTNRRLALDARELVHSLGYRSGLSTRPVRGRNVESSVAYTITFTTDDDVFALERKRLVHKERRRPSTSRLHQRFVVEVERIDSVPVRCVEIDHASHLYLASESMVPTHNSTLGIDIVRSAAIKHGMTAVVFSLEMSRNEITMRLLSAEARVHLQKLRTGQMGEDDWQKLAATMGKISEAPLFIDDSPNMSLMEIRAKCRRLKQRHDLKIVVIDYLQLMSSGKRVESRQQEVSEFSRALKLMAKELEVPVIAISQLNRGPEQRTDKKPQMSDLRESGCLTEDARILRADTGAETTLGELFALGAKDVPVWALDDRLQYVRRHLTHVFPTGTKPVYRLRLASGKEVTATANHPFLTYEGWTPLGELEVGSRLGVPRHVPGPERTGARSDEDVRMLARLVIGRATTASSAWADELWPAQGVRIPSIAFHLPKEQIALFLRTAFSEAASVELDDSLGRVALAAADRSVLDGLALLLLRFGISVRLRHLSGAHRLDIVGKDDLRRFLQEIGLDGRSAAAASTLLDRVRAKATDDRAQQEWRADLREVLAGAVTAAVGGSAAHSVPLGRIVDVLDQVDMDIDAVNDLLWDEVVAIEPAGERAVFDATVLGTHNFIANGIAVHNSIEQDADMVILLHREDAYEKESPRAGEADLIVAKHRNGPTDTITVAFQGHYSRFVDMQA